MVSKLSEITGRDIFTEEGNRVGTLQDITLDADTGRILGLLINRVDTEFSERIGIETGKGIVIPYSAVKSMGDIVLIRAISSTGPDEV